MPLRQRIHFFLTRYATHLRVASFLAALATFALMLHLANPWHTLFLILQNTFRFVQTHSIPEFSALSAALFLFAILYSRIFPSDYGGRQVSSSKRKPNGRLVPTILIVCALAGVFLIIFIPQWNVHRLNIADSEKALTHIDEEMKDAAQIVLGLFGLYVLYLNWRRAEAGDRTVETMQQGHITDRYTKAIEQLGATKGDNQPNIEVRLGAIYALERIAWDSPRDHWTIMEVLTAYIRENAPAPTAPDPEREPPTEIQAILDVLKRRNHEIETRGQLINLRATDLHGADLSGIVLRGAIIMGARMRRTWLVSAQLQEANLEKAELQDANLSSAQLQGANLLEAQLQGAKLQRAQLQSAWLTGTQLQGAIMSYAELERAFMVGANLRGANLVRAQLQGANLGHTDFEEVELCDANLRGAQGCNVTQIQKAINWEYAHYDPKFRRELGLPDDPEPTPPTPEPT